MMADVQMFRRRCLNIKLGLRSCGKNVTGASEKRKKIRRVKKRKAVFTYKKKSLKNLFRPKG